jgi:iron complex outermembrane receptor protein
MNRLSGHCAYLLAALTLLSNSATAQAVGGSDQPVTGTELAEITVTATKRSENLQRVPVTVSAVSGDTLSALAIDEQAALPQISPSLSANNGSGFFSPYIRGVGTQYANLGLESSVATYFDDQYVSRPVAGLTSFTDVARIEVLKGPQGTLYGRNSAAGAIRIITNDPTNQFEAKASIGYGAYDRKLLEGMINIPITPVLSARVAVSYDKRRGFVDDVDPGHPTAPDVEDRDRYLVRGKLLFQPNDDFKVKLSVDYSHKNDTEGQGFINIDSSAPTQVGLALGGVAPTGFYQTSMNNGGQNADPLFSKLLQTGVQLRADWTLPFATLSAISTYRSSALGVFSDVDTTNIPYFQLTYFEHSKALSDEFQAISSDAGKLQWVAGLYYYREYGGNDIHLFGEQFDDSFGVPYGPNVGQSTGGPVVNAYAAVNIRSLAPYFELSYHFTDQFYLTLGARETWEHKELSTNRVFATGVGATPIPIFSEDDYRTDFNKFTPKATLSYEPTANSLVYLTYSQGFKSGGINTPTFAPANTIRPEVLNDYEIGLKSEFRRVRFNAAAFYYDYKNLQVQITDQSTGGNLVENAASARIYGLETEITTKVADGFEVGVGASYLHARYENYIGQASVAAAGTPACSAAGGPATLAAPCLGYVLETADFSGRPMLNAPTFSGYVHPQYTIALPGAVGSLSLNGLLSYSTKYYYVPEETLYEPARALLSASLRWLAPGDHFGVAVSGENLTGREYDQLKTRNATGGYRIAGFPRMWLLQLSYKY